MKSDFADLQFGNLKTVSKTKRIAYLGMLCAAAIIFSYVEAIIPISIVPVPGFKIGFANIVILMVLYCFDAKSALIVNVVRATVTALLFSGIVSVIFSLFGGILSVFFMWLVKRSNRFSIYSVSVAGAVAHNCGQLIAAYFTLLTPSVFVYLPWLMVCSLLSGILIAIITGLLINVFSNISSKQKI